MLSRCQPIDRSAGRDNLRASPLAEVTLIDTMRPMPSTATGAACQNRSSPRLC